MSLKLREHHSYVSLITYHKMTPKSTLECLLAYKEEFNPRFVLEHRTPVMPRRNPFGFRNPIIRESLANMHSMLRDSSRHQTWRTRRCTRILRRRERAFSRRRRKRRSSSSFSVKVTKHGMRSSKTCLRLFLELRLMLAVSFIKMVWLKLFSNNKVGKGYVVIEREAREFK